MNDNIGEEITHNIYAERSAEVKHPTYDSEMAFYNLIAEGKIQEAYEIVKSVPGYNDAARGVLSQSPIRNAMYHFVAGITMTTRVCISKGMPQDIAYKFSDTFIRRADECSSLEEIGAVQKEAFETYANYINESVRDVARSRQIIKCVDYIRENIHGSLTVTELAEIVDLNETYLSKLFKKEMGCSVSEYIRNEKIEEACWLLKYTDKTSMEIATDLSFSSHSYFISVFKKVTGTTPKEYRNNNYRRL